MIPSNSTPQKQKRLAIIKWSLAIFFFILALGMIADKAIFSALLLTLGGLLLLPPLSNYWDSKLPFLRHKYVKGGILFALFIVGLNANKNISNNTKCSKSEKYESSNNGEFDEYKMRDSITAFIDRNKGCLIIKNMDLLIDYNNLFSENNVPKWSWVGVLLYDEKTRTSTYQPFVGNGVKTESFLKNSKKEKPISDYKLKFYFDNKNKVQNVEAIVSRGNISQVWNQNDSTDLNKIVLQDAVEARQEIVKEQTEIAERKQKKTEQDDNFKEHCLSSWDGTCPTLERYVKENLKDPDSYEHIETGFWNMGDHAVVLMKYRAKNSFGGYNVEAVKAEVSWDCELIRIIEYIR